MSYRPEPNKAILYSLACTNLSRFYKNYCPAHDWLYESLERSAEMHPTDNLGIPLFLDVCSLYQARARMTLRDRLHIQFKV